MTASSRATDAAWALNEAGISGVFERLRASEQSPARYFVRHPVTTARMLAGLARLTPLHARPSASASGRVLRDALPASTRISRRFGHRSLLPIPRDAAEYREGSSAQTLRRKVRHARAKGVTWARVDAPEERQRIFQLAAGWELVSRGDGDRPDNSDLFDYDSWLAAYSITGEPIMLAVTPIDGEWGVLRYFRIIGEGPEQSDARYLMMQVLVEELSARGVRYLVDAVAPMRLTNGLRHFQRMVGFRVHRVRAERASR